jgi:transposase
MPQSKSMALRQSIIAEFTEGKSISSIAFEFKVSRGTVYGLINQYKSRGAEGIKPAYQNCGKKPRDNEDFIFRAVRCMRAWHSTWGAEKIWAEMRQMRPELKLPHYRTFVRWFHLNGQLEIPLRNLLPKPKEKMASRLHEGWQIDAKEEMRTRDGSKQCWLNITDEYSGTVVSPPVFPL